MVLLHLKQSDEHQFLYGCPTSTNVDELTRDVASIYNLQLRLLKLKEEIPNLVQYGPIKDPNCNEEDSDDEVDGNPGSLCRGPFYNKDPTSRRTGEACNPEIAHVLTNSLSEHIPSISKEQVLQGKCLTIPGMKEILSNIKGAIMICYPMGLPKHDPIQQALNDNFEYKEAFDPSTAQLWWAGKELQRENKLSYYIGKNEKTKMIIKLQSKGLHAPPREPPVDEETQKAMMAWYYKQQKEQEKLKDDEDDSFLASAWADPRALKRHFNKTNTIQFR